MAVRVDDHFLEELKSRLRPSDVIGRSVKLRKQGREYVGLSPFNREKTPSFYVNDEKGQFFDFSSGKNGDLISFLQETERLTFMEAVERLAAEAGMTLPAPDPRAAEQERERQGLAGWMEAAAGWFEAALRRPEGQAARAYLERRGLPQSEWARFRLGYSPPARTALKDYLITKGARPAELIEAGLLIAPEDGGAPYDRFRDRIIFPIADFRGRILSFGGRAMDPQARAKYLNGPESPLFHKGRTLYGIGEARKILAAAPAGQTPPLVVVEGYMDAIACQRAGIAAVAPLGTALTEDQMEALWRVHPEPTLAFDGDRAGRQAVSRAIDRALPLLKPEKTLRFALVQGGKDPDEVLREQGAAALRQQLSETTPFAQALFEREREAGELDTPERRTALKVRLRKAAATIADKDLALAYKDDLLSRFEALSPLKGPINTVAGAARALSTYGHERRGTRKAPLTPASEEGKAGAAALNTAFRPLAAALAVAAIKDPTVIDGAIEQVAAQGFGDPNLNAIAQEIVRLRFGAQEVEADLLLTRLRQQGVGDPALRRLSLDASRAGVSAPFLDAAIDREAAHDLWRRAYDLLMRLEALERAAVSALQDLERDMDMATFSTLKAERDALRRLVNSDWRSDEAAAAVVH